VDIDKKENINSLKVKLADEFKIGNLNEAGFVDFPFMTLDQKTRLAEFIQFVSNEQPLAGKNKESWLDDLLNEIPETTLYRDGNYWHFHCGPYSQAIKSMTFNLRRNIFGLTSAEVYHYTKAEDNTINIVGFSPDHLPFPKSDVGYNPLFPDD